MVLRLCTVKTITPTNTATHAKKIERPMANEDGLLSQDSSSELFTSLSPFTMACSNSLRTAGGLQPPPCPLTQIHGSGQSFFLVNCAQYSLGELDGPSLGSTDGD